MKKHHLVVGTIIGGMLLAATMHSASTFALSDTSSTTDAPSSDTPSTDTSTTPADGATADGSTASQTDSNAVDSTSTNGAAATDSSDPSTPAPSTDPTTNSPNTADPAATPTTDPPTTDTTTTNGNSTTVNNSINGTSQSGDATVSNNNHGGNATSGDASGVTTLLNAIASSSDLNGGLQTFTLNINGTKNGNILLDPSALLTLAGSNNQLGNLQLNTQNNSTINNTVNLSASSGNAAVSNNGHAGNATSGNAATEADIVNLIESLISDQKAFLGVININGRLNGNILIPASVIDQLLKANGAGTDPNSNVVAANNLAVNNNVNLSAQSGDASVTGNDHGGNTTSGDATTKLNIYNLINSQIVGGNVLLVFVNVMGSWYGVLMNAPAGTTSAALGGGITQNNMGGDASVPANQVFGTNNETINNNVTLTSQSGNATVSGNHRGGNATTGNASAVADIVNILGSQISLSGWLGILVINVFGTWNGSLSVQQVASVPHPGTHHGGSHHSGGSSGGKGYAYYINYASTFSPAVTNAVAHVLGDTSGQFSNFNNDDKPVAVVFDHTKSNSKVLTDAIIAGLAATLAGAAGAARYFGSNRKKGQQQ